MNDIERYQRRVELESIKGMYKALLNCETDEQFYAIVNRLHSLVMEIKELEKIN